MWGHSASLQVDPSHLVLFGYELPPFGDLGAEKTWPAFLLAVACDLYLGDSAHLLCIHRNLHFAILYPRHCVAHFPQERK